MSSIRQKLSSFVSAAHGVHDMHVSSAAAQAHQSSHSQVINATLTGKDVLVILPAGAFQLTRASSPPLRSADPRAHPVATPRRRRQEPLLPAPGGHRGRVHPRYLSSAQSDRRPGAPAAYRPTPPPRSAQNGRDHLLPRRRQLLHLTPYCAALRFVAPRSPVSTPVIPLFHPQVMALRRLGVRCGDLTTLTSQEDSNALMKELDDPKSTLRLVYCTPEKVVKSKRFFAKLEKAYKARLGIVLHLETHFYTIIDDLMSPIHIPTIPSIPSSSLSLSPSSRRPPGWAAEAHRSGRGALHLPVGQRFQDRLYQGALGSL